MLEIGVLSFLFLCYFLNNNYRKYNFLAMFSVLCFVSAILIYKIPLRILVTNMDIISLAYYIIYGVFIIYWVSTLDQIKNSELGVDIDDFFNFIFPTANLKLFALFFMAQFVIGNAFLLSIFFYMTIATLMHIEKRYALIIVFISTILSKLVFALDSIFSNNTLSFTQIQATQQVNDIIIAVIYLLALLWVSVIYLLNYEGQIRILDVLKKRFFNLIAVVIGFELIFYILTAIINVRDSILLASVIMLVIIAAISSKFRVLDKPIRNKELPYMLTFLLIIILILFANLIAFNLYLSTILLIAVHIFLKKKILVNQKQPTINKNFKVSIFIVAIISAILISVVNISDLNNLNFGINMGTYLTNNINQSSNEIEVFLQIVSMSFYVPFFGISTLLSEISTVSYLVITVYFSSIFTVFNFTNSYLILNYSNLDEEDTHNVVLSIAAFMFITMLMTLLIIFIMKGI